MAESAGGGGHCYDGQTKVSIFQRDPSHIYAQGASPAAAPNQHFCPHNFYTLPQLSCRSFDFILFNVVNYKQNYSNKEL